MKGIRQHVNPLGEAFMRVRARRLERPPGLASECAVEVELGCADADFSFELAERRPDAWVCGLEIRERVLVVNRARAREHGLKNLSFGYVNLNVDVDQVFGEGEVDRFHVLFPDPWFKKRHQKRRVIEPWLLGVLRRQLRPGGELHFASDVFEVALEAMSEIEDPAIDHLGFRNLAGPWSFWRGNPFPAASRRERTTLRRGQRVWRMRYRVP
ncbi:MAG: methyltransferase domain-containing protein [Myxococcales bacterium]|nr:methyltransferase domain-containing protein [Myxococcales bacterium]